MKPFKVIGKLEKRVRQLAMRLENPPSQGENCSYPSYFQLIKIERSIDVAGKKICYRPPSPFFISPTLDINAAWKSLLKRGNWEPHPTSDDWQVLCRADSGPGDWQDAATHVTRR